MYAGDSTGHVHLLKAEVAQGGLLQRLVWICKTRPAVTGNVSAPVIGLQYAPFCGATGSPVLLVTTRGSTVAVLKVLEVRHEDSWCCSWR